MGILAQLFVWLGLVATAISLTAIVAVGLHYNPGSFGAEYVIAAAAVIVLPALLLFVRTRHGPFSFIGGVLSGAVGMVLFFGGAVITLGDPGDALLYIGPMILGFGLIGLAVEQKPKANETRN